MFGRKFNSYLHLWNWIIIPYADSWKMGKKHIFLVCIIRDGAIERQMDKGATFGNFSNKLPYICNIFYLWLSSIQILFPVAFIREIDAEWMCGQLVGKWLNSVCFRLHYVYVAKKQKPHFGKCIWIACVFSFDSTFTNISTGKLMSKLILHLSSIVIRPNNCNNNVQEYTDSWNVNANSQTIIIHGLKKNTNIGLIQLVVRPEGKCSPHNDFQSTKTICRQSAYDLLYMVRQYYWWCTASVEPQFSINDYSKN